MPRSLRIGLTGGLGSGKSTVAALLAEKSAHILSADELARQLMEPGTAVFASIVARFGPSVVLPDGHLDRRELARLAFAERRVEELNAIVHPATIALQGRLADAIFARNPRAVVVVESALIFETRFGQSWRDRFDRIVLVTAPDSLKIERFVARSAAADRPLLEAEARQRLSHMIPDEQKENQCSFVLRNQGSLEQLQRSVDELWEALRQPVTSTVFLPRVSM